MSSLQLKTEGGNPKGRYLCHPVQPPVCPEPNPTPYLQTHPDEMWFKKLGQLGEQLQNCS